MSQTAPERPSPSTGLSILTFVLASITALGPFSMDFYLAAMPAIGREFGASSAQVQQTVAVFMIGTGVGQLVFGPLSDRFGRRLPVLIGLTVYIGACAGCALSADIGWLIAFRLLQALAVCAGQVAARALLADVFEARELARYSSMLSTISMVAPVIGPLAGSYLFSAFGWRTIFWVLMAYGVLVLAGVARHMPETRTAEAKARSRQESPLASYRAVAGNWPLMRMALAGAFGGSAFFTYLGNAPHLIIEHFGVPAGHFGYYFAANAGGLMCCAHINRWLLKRRGPADVLRWSMLLSFAVTIALAAAAHIPAAGKWGFLVPLFVLVSVYPFVLSNALALTQGMDRSRGGAVAAVAGFVQSVVAAASVAASGALGDGGPVAMTWVMILGSGIGAALFLSRRKSRPA